MKCHITRTVPPLRIIITEDIFLSWLALTTFHFYVARSAYWKILVGRYGLGSRRWFEWVRRLLMVWVFLCFLSDSLFFKDLEQIPQTNASLAISPSPLSSSYSELETWSLQSLKSLAFWSRSGESMMRRPEEGETSFQLWRLEWYEEKYHFPCLSMFLRT